MTYLEAVNRILRLTTLMQWDDDDITSFTQTQHSASITLCRQAIQHVVNDLTADRFFYPEDATGHLTMVSGTRLYSLASDFVRLRGKRPWMFQLSGASGTDASGQYLYEYPGGELQLQKDVNQYTSQTGTPQWFYFTDDREVGIYPIPDSSTDGKLYRYEYEKDVMPENESDSLPVYSDAQGYAFCDSAAQAFKILFASQPIEGLDRDSIYMKGKTTVIALSRKTNPSGQYGYRYSCPE